MLTPVEPRDGSAVVHCVLALLEKASTRTATVSSKSHAQLNHFLSCSKGQIKVETIVDESEYSPEEEL